MLLLVTNGVSFLKMRSAEKWPHRTMPDLSRAARWPFSSATSFCSAATAAGSTAAEATVVWRPPPLLTMFMVRWAIQGHARSSPRAVTLITPHFHPFTFTPFTSDPKGTRHGRLRKVGQVGGGQIVSKSERIDVR